MGARSNGRVRRSASDWREIFSHFERSGLSIGAFCKRESLNRSSFHRWRSQLASPKDSYVELDVPTPAPAPSLWAVELELPGNILLRVRA